MKVTDLYPIFYAEDLEGTIKRLTEDFGFSAKHEPRIEFLDYVVLENEKNRRMDVVRSRFPADSFKDGYLGMRVNVDNFEEGVSYFKALGYNMFGDVHENGSFITALFTKGDGSYLVIFQHKK